MRTAIDVIKDQESFLAYNWQRGIESIRADSACYGFEGISRLLMRLPKEDPYAHGIRLDSIAYMMANAGEALVNGASIRDAYRGTARDVMVASLRDILVSPKVSLSDKADVTIAIEALSD